MELIVKNSTLHCIAFVWDEINEAVYYELEVY